MIERHGFFPPIRFHGQLRPSQSDAIEIARRELAAGGKRLHIVAPPGAGKTVLGLYLWAECIRKPALVLSPNSAIQAQWAARVELFRPPEPLPGLVSTDGDQPAWLTSLTYQSVTLPASDASDVDREAVVLWAERLIEAEEAQDFDEAYVWIEDLKRHNPEYHDQRLAVYRKQIRDAIARGGDALALLHASSRATLVRLAEHGVGMVVLDECHHLMGHWGRVLADAHDLLGEPVIVGLTATPPDRRGRKDADTERYDTYFGPIDYEVPVPAVVKDGYLAPYQDLAYFVRPTEQELAFLAGADEQLHGIIEELCRPAEPEPADPPVGSAEKDRETNAVISACEPLPQWLTRVLRERELPTGKVSNWAAFERRDPSLATAARVFLKRRGLPLPEGVPDLDPQQPQDEPPEMDVLVPVLDRYVRHRLRRSADPQDRARAKQVTARLRMLGVQITETGTQACASPISRVLAYAQGKVQALLPILGAERAVLGEKIRAVVVTDFEKTSAVTAEVSHLLDAEAGGAVAVYRTLLSHPETDALNPVLVTGSSVLVDDDLAERFLACCREWLAERNLDVEITSREEEGFRVVNGRGGNWCPRVYVEMITDLFQQGIAKCLVGTRGLLGEGWDAEKVNVLVDLTTVTTSMSVNQLRGRSMRLDPADPAKVANNWDVICIAPEFTKGLDDYRRFIDKHKTLFGVTDDGEIEKGVGHVHAALTELKPEGLEGSVQALNDDMLARVQQREQFRGLWRIGEPFDLKPRRTLEIRAVTATGGLPPFRGRQEPWNTKSLTLAVAKAVLAALRESGQIASTGQLQANERDGGYVRLFLLNADEGDAALFLRSVHEALGPLDRPRYIIPRRIHEMSDTLLSRLLPQVLGRYFRRRDEKQAMLHAVPAALAHNKELAETYQRHWNRLVSPGRAAYALHGSGQEMLDRALQAGQSPGNLIHEKEVFG